ncbi:hypothetical protein BDB01DRAFT_770120 [Pilobolus umbonatus]|nr:hypothetical protein BDB01DRAFT_770120 [Pilobolus umbonatus]
MNSTLVESVNDCNEDIGHEDIFTMDSTRNDLYLNSSHNVGSKQKSEEYHLSDCSSEEDELDFKLLHPHAPPPSPQETSMLDMLFSKKLSPADSVMTNARYNNNSGDCMKMFNSHLDHVNLTPSTLYSNPLEHAQTLDNLLRKAVHQQQSRGVTKRQFHRRSSSLQSWIQLAKNEKDETETYHDNTTATWHIKARRQKMRSIVKAAEHLDKIKRAMKDHSFDEDTATLINELKDMGL